MEHRGVVVDENKVLLRRADGTLTAEGFAVERKRKIERAKEKRATEHAIAAGAGKRAELYPRSHLGPRALAAATKLVNGILCDRYPTKTAREAATAAKLLVEIGRLENAEPDSIPGAPQTPDEREARIESIKRIRSDIAGRTGGLDGDAELVDDPS